uniref:NADH dehydrogenase [ubiquinone] 1 beta subcomplex subunit 7 n=1 Tax=Peronospora matthiolae TaxID=2874970 RepID=A0AAV1VJ60_9STRA
MSGGHYEAPRIPTRQEMADAKVPLHYRDTCAGLLIPLNECRRGDVLSPVEVPRPAPCLREVPVRGVEDSRGTSQEPALDLVWFLGEERTTGVVDRWVNAGAARRFAPKTASE